MSTNCRIGILNPNGTVQSIYNHWDGYIDCVGKILLNHYTDEVKVRQLIDLGDLSMIGEEIGEKHFCTIHAELMTPEILAQMEDTKICHFYIRDYERDYYENRCELFNNITDFFKNFSEDYAYLFFSETKTWVIKNQNSTLLPVILTLEDCK